MTNTGNYRVRWEIDVDANSKLDAALKAEAIMRTTVDGSRDQARVMEVRPINSCFWTQLDLANPALEPAMAPVLPPHHFYMRARAWKIFHKTFAPVQVSKDNYLVEPCDMPKETDPRDWWTIVDYAPDAPRLYIIAGITRVNRLGCIRCLRPWGGNADDHPVYLYQ